MNNIEICKSCENRYLDPKSGINCSITKSKPDFIESCPSYLRDKLVEIKNIGHSDINGNYNTSLILKVLIIILMVFKFISCFSINLNVYLTLLITLVYLLASIFFIFWFWTTYNNLSKYQKTLNFSSYWTLISWFIPFINLYRPYSMMKEMQNEYSKLMEKRGSTIGDEQGNSIAVIRSWWILWLASWIISLAAYGSIYSTEGLLMMYLDNLVFIVLSAITIKMISYFSKTERILFGEPQLQTNAI